MRVIPGTHSVSANVPMGLVVGATPDGRNAYEPLADAESPYHGTDLNGPTAVLKSNAKLEHIYLSGGSILNLKFHPSSLDDPGKIQKFVSIIITFFDLKGMELQCNVVSADTLRDAQKHPEQYQDLVVRVAGYCALFIDLDPAIQEDIIGRTEHAI